MLIWPALQLLLPILPIEDCFGDAWILHKWRNAGLLIRFFNIFSERLQLLRIKEFAVVVVAVAVVGDILAFKKIKVLPIMAINHWDWRDFFKISFPKISNCDICLPFSCILSNIFVNANQRFWHCLVSWGGFRRWWWRIRRWPLSPEEVLALLLRWRIMILKILWIYLRKPTITIISRWSTRTYAIFRHTERIKQSILENIVKSVRRLCNDALLCECHNARKQLFIMVIA